MKLEDEIEKMIINKVGVEKENDLIKYRIWKEEIKALASAIAEWFVQRLPKEKDRNDISLLGSEYALGKVDGFNDCLAEIKERIKGIE